MNCVACKTDLTSYHSAYEYATCAFDCDKCAWFNIEFGLEEHVLLTHFLSKYNGNNICMECDRKLTTDVEYSINISNYVIGSLINNRDNIEKKRINMLYSHINCFNGRFRELNMIISMYVYEK